MNEQVAALGCSDMRRANPHLSVRRTRDPPKNKEGQIFCDHTGCQASPPTFRRRCEWNKHMDKHDRPYKCYEPDCEKIQGFTYSGGLLRHQREVHKKNEETKKPMMCPYADCNRSTGEGFTRQENLREHLRRRHMHREEGATASILVGIPWKRANELEGVRTNYSPATALKRKHDSPNDKLPDSEEKGEDLHNEVMRLRHEVLEKDRRLAQLERIVADLQQAIPKPPILEKGPQITQAMPSFPGNPDHRAHN